MSSQNKGTAALSALLFAAMGILCGFFYFNQRAQVSSLRERGRHVEGVIVEVMPGRAKKDPLRISYSFEADGKMLTINGRTTKLAAGLQKGEALKVVYDPENPKRCLSEHESGTHDFAILFLITGVLCVVFAGLRFYLVFRSGRS